MDDYTKKLEEEIKYLKNKLEILEKNRKPLEPLPIRRSGISASNTGIGPMANSNEWNLGNRETDAKSENINLDEDFPKLLHYLKSILGYTIKYKGSRILLRSIYAFCEEDIFEIEIKNNKIIFHCTDYLNEWEEQINSYIKMGRSYAAFFAAVTLDLFNKRTFG